METFQVAPLPLQVSMCMCVCMYVLVSQLCPTLWHHGLWPARLLCPWNSPGKNIGVGGHSLLQESSQPRDWSQISCIAGRFFTIWATREATQVSMCESHSVVSNSLWPHRLKPTRLLCSWNSPGQNTGVSSHFLLQGIFPTQGLNPGLLHCRQIHYHLSHQGRPRIVGWVAYPFSRGSSRPWDWTQVYCIAGRFFTSWATREATQVSIRMQIYFYVRARMSGITQQALMTQWELGAEMGWMDSVRHRKLHQPFHLCLTCFLIPYWGLVFMFVPADWAILPWDRVCLLTSEITVFWIGFSEQPGYQL